MSLAGVYAVFMREFPAYTVRTIDEELTDEQIYLLLEVRIDLERKEERAVPPHVQQMIQQHGGNVRVRHFDIEDLVDKGVRGF